MKKTFSIAALLLTITCAGWITGCGDKKQDTKVSKTKQAKKSHADEHDHEGPHGGHVIELGGEYHAELTHDDTTKVFGVYLLGSDAKKTVTTEDKEIIVNLTVDGAPKEYKLAANPQPTDPQGQSSRFELKDEELVDAWDAPKTKGRLRVNLDGKPYSGEIEGHAH